MTLSELIVGYRTDHKISQRQFAKLCGVSNGYISMLESGINPKTGEKMIPTIPMLQKIAKPFGMSLDELLRVVDDIEVEISTDAAIMMPAQEEKKKIAMHWLRYDATKEEKLEVLRELSNLL